MEGRQRFENAERFVGATNRASVLREPVERGACVKPRDDGLGGLLQPLRDFFKDETCRHTAWPVEHLAQPQMRMEDEVCRSGNFYLPNWQTLNLFCLTAQALVRGR